jgi:hypothetical protein
MSRTVWNEKKIAERLKSGYGQGHAANYKPWLEITDLSSLGRSRRVWSPKTERTHHLFSDVEHDIFLASEWSRSVVDIREQYPLDRELTQTIAHGLKIRHPHYPGTQTPTVMTVDFLLTLLGPDGEHHVALNAKRDEEAEDATSLEKLEIQRTYFEKLEIAHHLVYHSQLPKQKINNIYWIRNALLKPGEVEAHPGLYTSLQVRMGDELSHLSNSVEELASYCVSFDERYNLETGTGLRVARMLMQQRALMPDLDSVDLARNPLNTFLMTANTGRLRAVGGSGAI